MILPVGFAVYLRRLVTWVLLLTRDDFLFDVKLCSESETPMKTKQTFPNISHNLSSIFKENAIRKKTC